MLATEATALLHGRDAANEAAETARRTFEEGAIAETLPTIEIPRGELEAGIGVLAAFVKAGLVASNGEARRQIKGGGLRVNDVAVTDEKMVLTPANLTAGRRDKAVARQEAPRPAEGCIGVFAFDGCGRTRKRAPCRQWTRIRHGRRRSTKPPKPARVALNVLALCFALSVLGRGLGESFTVFLKPISENFGWDRAQVVSVYSLTWLAGGLTAPLVGRLFDRSGPRIVYALGLLLLGGAFLIAAHAQTLWQFQLSVGLCVGLGIALIGNVPNSILLGRWFGPRLPTAMAIIYSATGAGILVLLPASQVLIDRIGWRDAYQLFGADRALSAAAAPAAAVAAVRHRLAAHRQEEPTRVSPTNDWTLASAMRHHAFWALFSTFFFTAVAMYAITAQIVAYLIDAGFPPLQAATAWGFSGVVLVFGMLGVSTLDGIIGRRPSVLFSYGVSIVGHHPALAVAVVSELLAAHRLRGLLRQHDRLARPADHGDRAEHLSRQAGRDDLRHDLDRQRARIGIGLLERRPDPRLDPQLQSADRVRAGQRGAGVLPDLPVLWCDDNRPQPVQKR